MKNEIPRADALLHALAQEIGKLTAERDALRTAHAKCKAPAPTESRLTEVLRAVLENKPGYREEIRQILGEYKTLTCEDCGALFPSGGKRKKRCGQCKV